ncbi:MAG: FtsW/RodA/SpoVE family cell cycle protein [Alphaproteobacteria bacterium]
MVNLLSRTDDSLLARWWWSIDKKLFKWLFFLSIVGLIISISAPNYNGEKGGSIAMSFSLKYLVFMMVGFSVFIFTSMLNVQWIKRLSLIGIVALIITLILIQFIGIEKKGAIRWISIFGFSLQPTEFVKPVFAVFSAMLFTAQYKYKDIPGAGLSFLLFLTFAVLFFIQPDMGQLFLLFGIWASQLFVVGLTFFGFALLLGSGVVGAILAYLFMPHFHDRVNKWIMPSENDTYQVDKSLQSFADGGWINFSFGSGTNKYKIPDANTDFVFAVIGEEGGVFFCILFLFLLIHIINLMIRQAKKQEDLFITLSVVAITVQFAMQSAINISSTIGLIPAKGMTLPLVSAGGSSYLAMCLGLGIIIALTRKQKIV